MISESCVDVSPLTSTVLPPLTSDVVAYTPMTSSFLNTPFVAYQSSSSLLEVPQAPPDDDDDNDDFNLMLDLFVYDPSYPWDRDQTFDA